MGWPYQFVSLSGNGIQLRREALDHYTLLAHLTGYIPILSLLAFRVGKRVLRSRSSGGRGAHSPVLKDRRRSAKGNWQAQLRRLQWWLDDDVYLGGENVGKRHQWALGILWLLWLLVFCVLGTGNGK